MIHSAPGDFIFRKGESIRELCFVVSGSLEVIQVSLNCCLLYCSPHIFTKIEFRIFEQIILVEIGTRENSFFVFCESHTCCLLSRSLHDFVRNEKQLLNSEFSRILNQLDYFDEKTNKKLTKKQDLFGLVDKLVKFWIHFSWKKVVSSSCREDYLLKKRHQSIIILFFCFLNHKMYLYTKVFDSLKLFCTYNVKAKFNIHVKVS